MSFELNIPGVESWTPDQLEKKEEAVERGRARRIATIAQSSTIENVEFIVDDLGDQEAQFSYQQDALCHLLTYLRFPHTKLKPFLDTILASSLGNCDRVFSATNLEIGRKARSGHLGCSDGSMEKWVSRQKEKLQQWQVDRNFQLVEIIDGEYDHETNRRAPTRYRVFMNKYVVQAVQLAKTKFYWRDGDARRAFRDRALRESARQLINEMPLAPNLAPKKKKELSEEQKFDRRHRSIMTFMEKNRDALDRIGIDFNSYFRFLITEAEKVAINPPGATGKLLTFDAETPEKLLSIWRMVKTGEIEDVIEANTCLVNNKIDELVANGMDHVDYAHRHVTAENRQIEAPKYYVDGKWVDGEQRFEGPEKVESVKHFDGSTDQTDISAEQPDIFVQDGSNPDKHSLRPNGHFCLEQTDIFVPEQPQNTESVKHFDEQPDKSVRMGDEELADLFDDVTSSEPPLPTIEELNVIFKRWCAQVRAKVPDLTGDKLRKGAFQIYWGEQFDKPSLLAENDLSYGMEAIAAGELPIEEFKRRFIAMVMTRTSYWKDSVRQNGYEAKHKAFREGLERFIELPGGFQTE